MIIVVTNFLKVSIKHSPTLKITNVSTERHVEVIFGGQKQWDFIFLILIYRNRYLNCMLNYSVRIFGSLLIVITINIT
jgi:hypothetical protein